ncbi:MAG: toxin-antitoxin system YwqK family antitoxin [bacterium]|nr:toxin-antitoxin system YwqK family antitoxin [bacterium]
MPAATRLAIALVLLTGSLLPGCASTRDRAAEAPRESDRVVAEPAEPVESKPDTRVIEENWPDGSRKLRKTVIKAPDGTVLDHGTYTKWHTNGHKEYEATYIDGKLHGTETSWHDNGERRAEAHYAHGLRHGTHRSWDTKGRLRKEENYSNDKPHGTWTIWTSGGKIKWQSSFDHGAVLP